MEPNQENNNFQKLLEHSEKQFHAQFDPNDPQYHGGDSRPVPIGGERIPESMKTMYPEGVKDPAEYVNSLEKQEKEINYGPEFDAITNQRTQFLNFKKAISKVPQILESIFRHQESLKSKGEAQTEAHIAKVQEQIKNETEQLLAALKEVEPLAKVVLDSEFKDRYEGLKEVMEQSKNEFKTKEELTDFGFKVKKYSANSFTDAGKFMDKLKKIKKEHQSLQEKQ